MSCAPSSRAGRRQRVQGGDGDMELGALHTGLQVAPVLAAMKRGARLVNVGRGPLVDEQALVDALAQGRLAGAALDVFTHEPLPSESPLWEMPGVIISPHTAGEVTDWRADLGELFLDNLLRRREGRPLRNVVDKALGYVVDG
ncbi:NAD(P)-dependent oxidoreductase [Streptomyces sp. DASNCL29]|uniref:NAD(P)-dependent oxidoreductase n=1 Tax=Streptomyces sp. DASNCL29 TaxID=2583819 RepID=UPI001F0D6808|nr:NAD(P)-dependent oxidoreductase [Streptomyces sp. DASNCL29]